MNEIVALLSVAVDLDSVLAPILQPYLLVMFSAPFYVDAAGTRWIDPLWAKDLLEHTRYIENLTLAACAVRSPAPAGAVAMHLEPGLMKVRCVDLPAPRHLLTSLWMLPLTCNVLWREIGRAKIVHGAVAGWPLAEAWLLVPLLAIRRRILYINVESAFWRLVPGEKASLMRRIRAVVSERLNRICVERSEISTFTHRGYRSSLLRAGNNRGHIGEASWIDAANLLTVEQLDAALERRNRKPGFLRMVFAGRLTRAKGILSLIEATALSLGDGVEPLLDIFGQGDLDAECIALVKRLGLEKNVRFRGTMPYDSRFFETLREYDVLVVPTLSDEQPRVVFDAYAQGLPVIASRTPGLSQCVDHGTTGLLFEAGNVEALREQIVGFAKGESGRASMARSALEKARASTHREMHRTRWRLLISTFPSLTRV